MNQDHGQEFYYCLTHKRVEPYDGCRSSDRLGPYPTREGAQGALESAAQRNDDWVAEDIRRAEEDKDEWDKDPWDTDPKWNGPV